MRIKSVEFSESKGTDQEWTLKGLDLRERNLIVGKNASGKTRVLNIINALALTLAGSKALGFSSADYDITFDNNGSNLRYRLKYGDFKVVEEEFTVDGKSLLMRGTDGTGEIWAEKIGAGQMIPFQTPLDKLAAVARLDSIQHPFLEPLHAWGSSLRHYLFGTPLGKDHWVVNVEVGNRQFDERDQKNVVVLYQRAVKELEDPFQEAVMSDMRKLEYDIDKIQVQEPFSIRLPGPSQLIGLSVKEKSLPGFTDQHSMSQGMFRALSIIIQVNYYKMSGNATCILIDDIGEGLDFERSWRLIDIMREKAAESSIQLVLSTNDRFVMNHVPLEEWSVLQREGGSVKVRNYENSKDVFEEFKFTGLSNFSFLEMDFVSGPRGEAPIHE